MRTAVFCCDWTPASRVRKAGAENRRLGRPALLYLPLHALEVENGVRQRAFHERRVLPSRQRVKIHRERDAALSRLTGLLKRGAFQAVAMDIDSALDQARRLSTAHTDRLGARAIDLLHVACALLLEAEVFLTFDQRQSALAKGEGLRVFCPPAGA